MTGGAFNYAAFLYGKVSVVAYRQKKLTLVTTANGAGCSKNNVSFHPAGLLLWSHPGGAENAGMCG
jgi:hypothetical protein